MYRAVFKVIEPYFFRGPGEFDPSARGVYSSAYSLLAPNPSTTAGALATVFGYVDTSMMDWDEAYSAVLKGARIRGPYLRRGSLYHVENRVDEIFLRLDDVQNYSYLRRGQLDEKEKLEEKVREIMYLGFTPGRLTMVGIGLMTRVDMRKIADEERGLIYTVDFIDYLSGIDAKIGPTDIAIEFDIISENMRSGKYVVRLGGEGRTSLLEILEAKDYICKIPEKTNLLYVLSPILYETGSNFIEQLKNEIEGGEVKVCGKIGLLGAGYSEVRRRRKPIYQALLPGSIIVLEKEVKGFKIYEEGIGIGRQLGFGSVIPIEG